MENKQEHTNQTEHNFLQRLNKSLNTRQFYKTTNTYEWFDFYDETESILIELKTRTHIYDDFFIGLNKTANMELEKMNIPHIRAIIIFDIPTQNTLYFYEYRQMDFSNLPRKTAPNDQTINIIPKSICKSGFKELIDFLNGI